MSEDEVWDHLENSVLPGMERVSRFKGAEWINEEKMTCILGEVVMSTSMARPPKQRGNSSNNFKINTFLKFWNHSTIPKRREAVAFGVCSSYY